MKTLITIFRIPELRNKLLFTLGMLVVYRFGSFITIPGVNPVAIADMKPAGTSFLDVVNVFSGGALFKLSIFSLGIMPYISASIIMNLMTVVIPPLSRLQREGEEGRKKINQYTRYGTLLLCAIQAVFILMWALDPQTVSTEKRIPLVSPFMKDNSLAFILLGVLTITTGTMLLMWIGEQMTERGIGNGVSLLIMAGIIAQLPPMLVKLFSGESIHFFEAIILMILFLLLISLSIILTQGVRKVPLQYGKKMQGRRMVQAQSQSIPFKLNSANVMPIIFASSLLLFPQTIIGMLGEQSKSWIGWQYLINWMDPLSSIWYRQIPYYFIYTLMIIFFTYFYTAILINPQELAENLKKYGGFVPGVRPGLQTREFLESTLNKITLPGALFLAGLALAPYLIINLMGLRSQPGIQHLAYTFGGTSLLIIVGVALDTLKQIESQLIMRNYDGFMKKKRIKGRY